MLSCLSFPLDGELQKAGAGPAQREHSTNIYWERKRRKKRMEIKEGKAKEGRGGGREGRKRQKEIKKGREGGRI